MRISKRTKATLGLVGAAVVTGVAVSGGLPDVDTASATTSAGNAVSGAVSGAVADARTRAVTEVRQQAETQAREQLSTGVTGVLDRLSASANQPYSTFSASAPRTFGHSAPVPVSWGNDPGKIMLVLDTSRSMRTPSGNTTRIQEAKQALSDVIADIPAGTQVGLRVYGSTVAVGDPNKPSAAACRDSHRVLPIAPVDKTKLDTVVSTFTPYGYTPTSYALRQAAKDLGDSGKRTIVLVSDGEESCGVDPAATARDLRAQGIDLTIDTVGLHPDTATSTQLRNVATAGGGTYTTATSASELEAGLRTILARMKSGTSSYARTHTTSGDVSISPASVSQDTGNQTTPVGVRAAQSAGGNVTGSSFFIPALVLFLLFWWLKDHK